MSLRRDDLVRQLLDRLESEEAKLLAWGVVEGAFTADDVQRFAREVIDAADTELTAGTNPYRNRPSAELDQWPVTLECH